MGKYEVTQASGNEWPEAPRQADRGGRAGDDLPVYNVNYPRRKELCKKLTEKGRKSGDLAKGWNSDCPTGPVGTCVPAGTRTATSFATIEQQTGRTSRATLTTGPRRGHPESGPAKVGNYPANAWGLHECTATCSSGAGTGIHAKLPGGDDPDLSSIQGTRNRDGTYSRCAGGGAWTDDGWPCPVGPAACATSQSGAAITSGFASSVCR